MIASGLGLRLEGDPGEGFLAVRKVFDGGPVARANAEALAEDPNGAEVVAEGDVLVGVGEHELGGLSEAALRELLSAPAAEGADLVLEFAHASGPGSTLEPFSIVVQVQAGGGGDDGVVEIEEGMEVVDLSAKSAKKSARAKREKELSEKRERKASAKTEEKVTVATSSYLKQLAEAPPVWEPPGLRGLALLGACAGKRVRSPLLAESMVKQRAWNLRPHALNAAPKALSRARTRGPSPAFCEVLQCCKGLTPCAAAAVPVATGGDFLSSLGAGAAGQTTEERLKLKEAESAESSK